MTEPPRVHHFLVNDVVGSTGLWDARPEAMHSNIRQLQRLTRSAVRDNGGAVFKTVGDGSCSVFESADDALAAAIRLRVLLAEATWKDVEGFDVRLAVHSGIAARYGGDLLGQGVNEVSKLCALADTKGVLVSVRSLDQAGDVPDSWEVTDERECAVPGLAEPLSVVDLLPRN